nr:hypothetical protein HmN_000166800 [Hymenolepis microstoma]
MTEGYFAFNRLSNATIDRITSCLDERDLINACLAFKSWDFLLKCPKVMSRFEKYLKQNANWLDGELCGLLDPHKPTFTNPCKAMTHYVSKEGKGPSALRTGSLSIIIDTTDSANDPVDPINCWKRIRFAECIYLDQNPLPKEKIEKAEVVIYAVDTSVAMKTKFQELCDLLKPQQKLFVVRFRYQNNGMAKSKLEHLYECYNSLSMSLKFISDVEWIITFSERPTKDVLDGKLAILWACFDLCRNYFVFPPIADEDHKFKL